MFYVCRFQIIATCNVPLNQFLEARLCCINIYSAFALSKIPSTKLGFHTPPNPSKIDLPLSIFRKVETYLLSTNSTRRWALYIDGAGLNQLLSILFTFHKSIPKLNNYMFQFHDVNNLAR